MKSDNEVFVRLFLREDHVDLPVVDIDPVLGRKALSFLAQRYPGKIEQRQSVIGRLFQTIHRFFGRG